MAQDIKYRELIKQEYKKCFMDPVYFMKRYCIIQHPQRGKIQFKLYPYQEKTLQEINENDYTIILKSRQLGISTLCAAYALWYMTFYSDKNIMVLATKQEVAKNLVTKVRVMYENLPSWIKVASVEDNKLSLRFRNGSQIKASTTSADSGRSEALSMLIVDEAAHIDNIGETWASAQQTLATGGKAILLSSPNGTGNFFHQTWTDSLTNPNSRFHSIRLPWTVHPERDQSWRDKQDELLGPRMAAQECVGGDSIVTVQDTDGNIRQISLTDLFTNINSRYKILTPNGFEHFDSIQQSELTGYVLITLDNDILIKCSRNHAFMLDNIKIYARELSVGCKLDGVDNTERYVKSIEFINEPITLYDIINVGTDSTFIVDTVVSHNCDADFISSGATLIDGELIKWYEQTTITDPVEKRGYDHNIWIWEYPDYTKQYVISADVARGDGKDYSAFHIFDVETLTQVAEYKGQLGTKEFGHMLLAMATEYNKALLVVENANVGWAALQPIIDSNYENLFYSSKDTTIVDVHAQLAKGYDLRDKTSMTPGFSTTGKTRPLLISKLDTVMRERTVIIRSKRLIEEFKVFIWKGDRAEAQTGYNDDLVMSFAIGVWVRDTAFKLRSQGLDLTKRTLDYISKTTPTTIYSSGLVKQTGWSMNNGKKGDEDLTWLL